MRLAEKADPLSSEIHRALAYVLPSAGRYDEAAGDCEKGVTPGSEVRAFLGYAYARTGRRALAEKMAIGTNPFN